MARLAAVCAWASLAVLSVAARPAHADTGEFESSYDPGKAERRSDVAVGLLLGAAAGAVSGYPNELAKLDDPKYQANTGFGGGTSGGVWVGGALRDWFVFGVGLAVGTVSGHGYHSTGTAFVFHLEAYPLFSRGGAWKDVGVIGEFGAGGRTITRGATTSLAEGGLLSIATVGVVYEPIHLGSHVSAGPLVEFTYQGSQSLTATFGTIGLRASFYGGPG
jgi:hypothetical protein